MHVRIVRVYPTEQTNRETAEYTTAPKIQQKWQNLQFGNLKMSEMLNTASTLAKNTD